MWLDRQSKITKIILFIPFWGFLVSAIYRVASYIKYKKDIRAYYNRFSASDNTYLVYANETGDGYIEKVKLPILGNYTKKEVEELFEENYFIQCPNSPWDCTGRPFTSYFLVYKNSYGEWWAYHVISLDV